MSEKYQVFISYSSREYVEADMVRSVLTTNEITCFMAPESIPGGMEYTKIIPRVIEGCEVLVLILSDNSQNSKWVSDEVHQAINSKKVVIPFAIENCTLRDEYNFMIGRVHRIEAYQHKSSALKKLVNSIKAIIDVPSEPQIDPKTVPETVHEGVRQSKAISNESKEPEIKKKKRDLSKWRKRIPVILLAVVIVFFCSYYLYRFIFPKDFTYHVNYELNEKTGELFIESDRSMPNYPQDQLELREWNDDRDKIKKVAFEEGAKNIGDNSFAELVALESVKMPDSMNAIGTAAFFNCRNLTDVEFNNKITDIGDFGFCNCNLPSLNLPESTASIGACSFAGNLDMTRAYIPASVSKIGRMAFASCDSLHSITVSDENTAFLSEDGNLYSHDKSILYQYAIGKTDETFVVPDGVVCIAEAGFENCRFITEIHLPDSVKEIEEKAFSGCTDLSGIHLDNELDALGVAVFMNCERLKEIILPDNLTSLPENTFSGCRSLKNVVLPEGLQSIGAGAFSGCIDIETIVIPDTVTEIGEDAFSECSNNLTLKCKNNRTVQNYAVEHGISFEAI